MSSYITANRFIEGEAGGAPVTFARRNTEVLNSAVVSFFAVMIVDFVFLLSSDSFKHWFIIPISICGILIGTDGVDWLRGRLELFDPAGILGVLGFHFFFLAPLLHVSWDFWMWEVSGPSDWRPWLGFMGTLNAFGLVLYRVCRDGIPWSSGPRTFWRIETPRFRNVLKVFLMFAAVLQIGFYISVGGIGGYMQAIQDDRMAFKGLGWLFMISESVPILTVFLMILYFQRGFKKWQAFGAIVLIFVLQMLFGGLRGSRSETVRVLFWAVGCFHLMVRRVPRKIIYGGCAFLLAFLYLYGFYKAMGANATEAFGGSDQRSSLEMKTRRNSQGMLLGDLGRADVQAFVLYKLTTDGRDFIYAKGRTYLGALLLPVPGMLLPFKPETKLQEGTEIGFGPGSYAPNVFWSSRVYGLGGESMLNFGALAVPIVYGLLGVVVGWFRKTTPKLLAGDARLLLVPFGAYMCFNLLVGDSDNLVFGMIKNGFLPFLVIWICTTRLRLPQKVYR
jgi:hypothetical protein